MPDSRRKTPRARKSRRAGSAPPLPMIAWLPVRGRAEGTEPELSSDLPPVERHSGAVGCLEGGHLGKLFPSILEIAHHLRHDFFPGRDGVVPGLRHQIVVIL